MSDFMKTFGENAESVLQERAYKKYQLDWMQSHGYSALDLVKAVFGYAKDCVDPEDAESSDIGAVDPQQLTCEWERDCGFGGELWAGKDEFLASEYRDAEYMKRMLTADEMSAWENFDVKE